jgi:type IV pilus assembly protein PilX
MKNGTNSRQNGATLVVAMLLLLVLTVLGLTTMNMSRLEERMAGNSRDLNLAFQGAEAGLRDAEERIKTWNSSPTTCSAAPCGLWQISTLPVDLRDQTLAWWTTNAAEYGVAGSKEITEVTRDPMVVIEELAFVGDTVSINPSGPPPGRQFYRITANSAGASDTAEVVLESTFVTRF